jgi:outer membrane protein assembly factor BamA
MNRRKLTYGIAVTLSCLFHAFAWSQDQQEIPVPDAQILKDTYVKIRDIRVTGENITRKYIINREIQFVKGASYSMSDVMARIKTSKEDLMNTALFVDVSVDFTRWFDDSLDIVVDVKERWYYFPLPYFKPVDRNWNVWINQYNVSLERVNYGLKFLANNFTGRNDRLNLWLINGYTRQVTLSYYSPYLDRGLKHGLGFDLTFAQNREINYTTRGNKQAFFRDGNKYIRQRIGFSMTYSYRKGSRERHYARLGFSMEQIADTVAVLNPKYFGNSATKVAYPELAYKYEYLDVNYIPYPLKGRTFEFNFLKRGPTKNMDVWFFNARYSMYWKLAHKFYFNVLAEGDLKLPFDQPFYNQQLLGYGDSYLRGLEYYVVDGVAGGFVRSTIRREVASFKWKTGLKSRIYNEIPFKIYLKAYGDFGYVYNKNNVTGNFLTNRFLYTGGFGVDILTIYDMVIRLEYSFNQLGERALFYHLRD